MVEKRVTNSEHRDTVSRRAVLQTAAAGALVGSISLASADPDDSFPPGGTTTYGHAVELGDGSARPFTTETPSGKPKYHGVEFDRAALDGLPDADELAASGDDSYTDKYSPTGEALEIHRRWSLSWFVPFPDATKTPFSFLGLNWNPNGHAGGEGAWAKPHFDIHFHMLEMASIDTISGPAFPPYDEIVARDEDGVPTEIESELADEQLPAGYARPPPPVAEERYITDMGEHAAPTDAPELPGNPDAFTNTLIQGFVDVGCDDAAPELAFIEPMITRTFLADVRGTESYEIPQPEVYPHDQQHPTAYSVREVPSEERVAVVIQGFEPV